MKEYRICYGPHHVEAGSNGWIPNKVIAKKIQAKLQLKPIFQDVKLELEERERTQKLRKRRKCNNKKVYNWDWFYCDALDEGDYVEAEVVEYFMNCIPPACYRSDCAQIGEAYNSIPDSTGNFRSTFMTFKRYDSNTWEFCGYCFIGENVAPKNNISNERRTASRQ